MIRLFIHSMILFPFPVPISRDDNLERFVMLEITRELWLSKSIAKIVDIFNLLIIENLIYFQESNIKLILAIITFDVLSKVEKRIGKNESKIVAA